MWKPHMMWWIKIPQLLFQPILPENQSIIWVVVLLCRMVAHVCPDITSNRLFSLPCETKWQMEVRGTRWHLWNSASSSAAMVWRVQTPGQGLVPEFTLFSVWVRVYHMCWKVNLQKLLLISSGAADQTDLLTGSTMLFNKLFSMCFKSAYLHFTSEGLSKFTALQKVSMHQIYLISFLLSVWWL